MQGHRIRSIMFVICLMICVSVFTVAAQDSPTPAPTMDMSGMDMSAEATPMADNGETTIRFAARVGDKDFACGMIYDGLGGDKSSVSVSDFRLYVSNVRLISSDNQEVPLELEQDGLWQYKSVALIDFEDGTSACGEGGNDQLRTSVIGTAPMGEYTGIVFDLSVPFELNHLDVATAASPLNLDAMWWAWQVGYKFLRVDMTANGNPYFIHLGSTGCTSANDTTPSEKPCSHSNRITVRMDGFDPKKNFVVADLASLINGIELSKSEPRPPGCMSGPDDPDCKSLFPNFGLSLDTGSALDGAAQQLFRIQ